MWGPGDETPKSTVFLQNHIPYLLNRPFHTVSHVLESPKGRKVSVRKGFLAEIPQRKLSPCATCFIFNLERSKRKTCVCAQNVSSLP